MHAVMDRLMYMRQSYTQAKGEALYNAFIMARNLKDEHFHDRKLTQDHLDTMIEPALRALHALEALYADGGPFRVLAVEQRVGFPGIPGAFGTCDLIIGNNTHIIHVDWKFGAGVPVLAMYEEAEGEKLNPQMMFYTVAAMNSLRGLYKGKRTIVIAIIQPRSATPLSHAEVTKRDLKWFIEDMHEAVVKALDRDAPRARGEHCRFAPCKVDCPLWTGPMLDLTALVPELRKPADVASKEATPYAQYLARAKELTDMAAMFTKEVNEQLHAYLEAGGLVPGWRLKPKAKLRQWVDEDTVEQGLRRLGFEADEIWDTKLVTFAKAEAAAKRRGVKIPDDLRVAPATNETTVCRADDPAPVVERQLAIEQFTASLKLLQQG